MSFGVFTTTFHPNRSGILKIPSGYWRGVQVTLIGTLPVTYSAGAFSNQFWAMGVKSKCDPVRQNRQATPNCRNMSKLRACNGSALERQRFSHSVTSLYVFANTDMRRLLGKEELQVAKKHQCWIFWIRNTCTCKVDGKKSSNLAIRPLSCQCIWKTMWQEWPLFSHTVTNPTTSFWVSTSEL